ASVAEINFFCPIKRLKKLQVVDEPDGFLMSNGGPSRFKRSKANGHRVLSESRKPSSLENANLICSLGLCVGAGVRSSLSASRLKFCFIWLSKEGNWSTASRSLSGSGAKVYFSTRITVSMARSARFGKH